MSKLKSFIREAQNKSGKESIPDQIEPFQDVKASSSNESSAYDQSKLDYDSKEQNIKERKKYARFIFTLICIWLGLILLILFFQGFSNIKFHLSDTVLITLITTTTANIAAYFLVVTKYLFPNSN
ncbi:MAG: hypothetical protein AAF363_10390 [Bacteroidota bacterium]